MVYVRDVPSHFWIHCSSSAAKQKTKCGYITRKRIILIFKGRLKSVSFYGSFSFASSEPRYLKLCAVSSIVSFTLISSFVMLVVMTTISNDHHENVTM